MAEEAEAAGEVIGHMTQAGQSMRDFSRTSAFEKAHQVLADQRCVVLDEIRWDRFVVLLEEPARPDPRLVELFARPQRVAR